MTDITLTHSHEPALDVDALAAGLRGRVISRSDAEYDDARRVWNGMIDKRPLLIVMCAGVADVVAAVNFVRQHELPVAVRGGGHNVSGTGVCDDGVVIDLSLMRGVRVDPERRTVWAQGGCTWADIDRETQPFGLAVPGGVVSETGVAGLTLSGGYSNQRRAHGMTIDNLVACEIVTADGRYLRASEDEHADLFWALRGGGGNFGVVTAFEYTAHPHGPSLYQAEVYYPVEQAREILAAWREAIEDAPDEITSTAVFWSFPAVPEIPAEMHGAPFLLVIASYAGPVEEGEVALGPLRYLGTPILDASRVVDYLEAPSSIDALLPSGRRYYWTGHYLTGLADDAIDLVTDRALEAPSPLSLIVVRQMGGVMGRVPAEATAFGDRSAPFHLSIDATWEAAEDDERNLAWAKSFWTDAQRFSSGQVYFNFAGLLEGGDEAVRRSFGRNYERLVDVKTAYDPGNLFRLNPNIAPR
jgi:FAD/FMN-containing dehydrogenase